MDIQTELQKIHHQFGVTEKANYEIQKLFDKLILEDRAEQLRVSGVVESFYCNQNDGEYNNNPCAEQCNFCKEVEDTLQ